MFLELRFSESSRLAVESSSAQLPVMTRFYSALFNTVGTGHMCLMTTILNCTVLDPALTWVEVSLLFVAEARLEKDE